MGLLEGKVAFITGGAQGMGRAHALASAREGADVVLFDVAAQLPGVEHPMSNPEILAATAKEVETLDRRVLTFHGDVRSQSALDAAVEQAVVELGKVDILIANAGIWTKAPFWQMSEEQWTQTIDVNLNGVWRSAKAVAPHMIARGEGSIVMVSSVNGLEAGMDYANYVAAKHGVVGLMRNVALELAPHGVRCNSIHPAAVNTPMANYQAAWDILAGHEGGTEEEMLFGAYHFHALKGATLLPSDDIADAAVFLNSHLARSITGVTLPVDAGHMILPGFNHAPVRT
jgi:SDR family mycofactocin-dependent oxidoreductase